MKTTVEFIQFLQSILEAKYPNRDKFIKEFQETVWNDGSVENKKLNELLSEIAYDLDFYEPDEDWRKESPNYFGDDRLEELVKTAIQKLKNDF